MRAQVAQLLAQNNRAGTADIAALATTLKALSASGGSAADIAKARVDAMEKVDKPEVVELQDVMP